MASLVPGYPLNRPKNCGSQDVMVELQPQDVHSGQENALKHCAGCDTWKSESNFNWKNRLLGRRQAHCKTCQSAWTKQHYRKHPEPYLARAKERNKRIQAELQEYVFEYLTHHPCVDCGESDPLVLAFDHVKGEKHKEISVLLQDSVSLSKVQSEIEKCQVRCANCHVRRHARERKVWKLRFR